MFWAPLAALGWLAALPLWSYILPSTLVHRYFTSSSMALFLLAGGAIPYVWHKAGPSRVLRWAWVGVTGVGLVVLLWYHKPAGAATLGGLGLALSELRFGRMPVRRVWAVAAGTALAAVALVHIFLVQWHEREFLPVTPFEAKMAHYLAEHSAPSDMVLTPLGECYQMVLNRPVVATFETRQFMSYMPSLAATTDKLFADLYGVRDGHWYDWNLWMKRSAAEWRALGKAYGFRYVLTKDFYPLHLHKCLEGEGLILYEIPKEPGVAPAAH